MTRTRPSLPRWLVAVLALAGCEATIDPGGDPEPSGVDRVLACAAAASDLAGDDRAFRGVYVPTAVDPRRRPAGKPPKTVIYLNREGATLAGNYDDAPHNASSVVAGSGKAQAKIPAYPGSPSQWSQLVACVKDEFSRFNVEVVGDRPSGGAYMMAMFGGAAGLLGFPPQVGGVAPLDNQGCQVIPNAVVFIFSGAVGVGPQLNCEIAAQEISHSFSLDHELLASDPMTYLPYNGHKVFRDQDAACGESQKRACVCQRPSQNSVRLLLDKLGPAGVVESPDMGAAPDLLPPAPTVTLLSPGDGDRLPAGALAIAARASGGTGALALTLHYQDARGAIDSTCGDGRLPCLKSGGDATFTVDAAPGVARFAVAAADAAGATASSETRAVTVGEPAVMDGISISLRLDTSGFSARRAVVVGATIRSAAGEVTSATLDWTGGGPDLHVPLCSAGGLEWRLPIELARRPGRRTFAVRAADALGHQARSATLPVSVE